MKSSFCTLENFTQKNKFIVIPIVLLFSFSRENSLFECNNYFEVAHKRVRKKCLNSGFTKKSINSKTFELIGSNLKR